MQKCLSRRLIQLSLAGLFAGFSANSFAAGFQLFEVNGAGTGDFYAGGAASANDASTAFFNPAGLVRMKNPQVELSGVNVFSNLDFKGTAGYEGGTPVVGEAQGGGYNFIPSLEYAAPINSEMGVGLSIASPFGLETSYDTTSFLRYAATKTSLQTIDVSPSIGFGITNNLSLGFGLDADRLDATYNSVVTGFNLATLDTTSNNEASGWGYGWHAGVLYQVTPDTRVGAAYRSKVSYSIEGTSSLTGPLAGGGTLSTNSLMVDTTLPAMSMLSVYHQFNPQWAGEATVGYTEWNVFNNVILQNVQSPTGLVVSNTPENYQNTWRVAIGGTYQPFEKWLFRAGLGYDQTPTVSPYRDVRLPDGNRTAAAIGAHYQAMKTLGLDVGWTHLFIQDGIVHTNSSRGPTVVSGQSDNSADIVGVQLTWDII